MHARYYALALTHFLAEHPRVEAHAAAERLAKVLVRRGHSKLLSRIISEYEKEVEKQERSQGATVTVADETSRAEALAESARIAGERGIEQKNLHVVVDEGLLGGFKLRAPGFRYDNSQRKRLQELYKTLTA